jgi:mRNA interferase HicA
MDTTVVLTSFMTSAEMERWLKAQGCTIVSWRGKGGHKLVRLGTKKTVLPTHGKNHELPLGTVMGIKKDLGLK